jgi:Protein of unknown function (DUF3574)
MNMVVSKIIFKYLMILSLWAIAPILSSDRYSVNAQSIPKPQIDRNFIKEELYFGLGEPEGQKVSETQWQLFLQKEITTRFPQGLTVVNAYGQYLDRSQELNRENTKLVILIHQNNYQENRLIEEIIAIYKKTFQQESVLRVTSFDRISF